MHANPDSSPAEVQGASRPWHSGEPARLTLRESVSIRLERARRWEFWPAWLFYLPIVMWIVWLGLKHRSPTAFTAANPALDNGGVVGERKHQALAPLQANAPELVAEFLLIPEGVEAARIAEVLRFARRVAYPLVLKPDIGQRGRGVFIARNESAARDYVGRFTGALIAQRYVGGEEYGVFIARRPGAAGVDLISIVHKTFPAVTGDGRRTLRELILDDARAHLMAAVLFRRWADRLNSVPRMGERMALVEIGSHCRGSLFLDASSLDSPALRETLTRLSEAVPGYDFGRIDLRVPSAEHLRRGEALQALELNGVSAESAHIYHPDTPLLDGYRAMFRQWSLAFLIGAAHQRRGVPLTSARQLLRLFRADIGRGKQWF